MENVTENNKLIAEFMGLELEETLNGLMVYAIRINRNNPKKINDIETEFFEADELKYHTSWEWLMPVVEKCMQTGDNTDEWDTLYNALSTLNITNTYKSVVEFIQCYNENK